MQEQNMSSSNVLQSFLFSSWYTNLAIKKAKKKIEKSKKAPRVVYKTGTQRSSQRSSQTPMTDDMRKKNPKRTCSSNTDDDEKKLDFKKLKEELSTTKELYEGQKARLTITHTSLEREKRKRTKIENRLKAVEEKYKKILEK